eukprot:4818654-Pyramimonas_sp.AAC.2
MCRTPVDARRAGAARVAHLATPGGRVRHVSHTWRRQAGGCDTGHAPGDARWAGAARVAHLASPGGRVLHVSHT